MKTIPDTARRPDPIIQSPSVGDCLWVPVESADDRHRVVARLVYRADFTWSADCAGPGTSLAMGVGHGVAEALESMFDILDKAEAA